MRISAAVPPVTDVDAFVEAPRLEVVRERVCPENVAGKSSKHALTSMTMRFMAPPCRHLIMSADTIVILLRQ